MVGFGEVRVWPFMGRLSGASASGLVGELGWCGMYYPSLLCVYVAIYGVLWWWYYAEVGLEAWGSSKWSCGLGVWSVGFV